MLAGGSRLQKAQILLKTSENVENLTCNISSSAAGHWKRRTGHRTLSALN